jgi:hypothetical protein
VLTARELAASLRVLRALRSPQCASVVLAWAPDEQRALTGLTRAGYVQTLYDPAPKKSAAPFRWDRIAATPEGLVYLEQVEAEGPRC